MIKIVILDPVPVERLDRVKAFLPDDWTLETAVSRAPQDQMDILQGADFAIVSDVPVTADMMATSGLRAVHKWGVGYDSIDCSAARAHGVRVLRTTGSNAVAVAETVLGLILALNRNLVRGHVAVAKGLWPKSELGVTSMRLSGKTVGIVGLGNVGKVLAKLLSGFGCQILYTGRTRMSADVEAELNVRYALLEDLLAQADVVSLNCALTDETRGMINRQTLGLMKPGSLLVNAARGGVVVEADLAEALRSGHLRGAASDVFSQEPVEQGNPLIGLDTAINTPHIAAISADGFAPTVTRMISNLRTLLSGEEPPELDVVV
ncbi:2-hydroxyacid dehydrogenase [Roseibium algae]|uniref:2-hydroxyacid dehydrogenase n=1 Tax=Roseibium algae TaxID=3123038 RepID=A0ABU8TK15_9HYPH